MNRFPAELIFWTTALVLLATAEPHHHLQEHHFTFCPLANMGIDWCPGCGLGRSVTQLFHWNLKESFKMHWFGVPATLIIMYRIVVLGRNQFKKNVLLKKKKENNYV